MCRFHVHEEENFVDEILQRKATVPDKSRIGASITIGSQFLPCYVKAFYNRYPGTEVKVTISPSEQLEQKIWNNELDFILIEGISHTPTFVSEEYMEDSLTVICFV